MFGDVLPVPDKPPLGYDAKRQGAFIVSLAADRFGGVWVGTEDEGVWHYNPLAPANNRWRQFTVKDGLGDNHVYSVVVDSLGRVWVGHLNHGVSVWNGQQWRNISAPEGPLGERIFAMAVSPNDGDVWMATNAGLSRYSIARNAWTNLTRAHGLPSLGATCLAFDRDGTLFVGTQCDGIAFSFADTDFKKWQVVRGPDALPNSDSGEGLPGSMINDLLVGPDNTIYAATTRGLARSSDSGETWKYLRGADWKDKLKGLFKPIAVGEEGRQTRLPREDYISCLALDERGLLWIGYRQRGYEVRDPRKDKVLYTSASNEKKEFPYVSAILPRWNTGPLLGTYNQGRRCCMNQFLCRFGRKSCNRKTIACAALKRELAQTSDSCNNAIRECRKRFRSPARARSAIKTRPERRTKNCLEQVLSLRCPRRAKRPALRSCSLCSRKCRRFPPSIPKLRSWSLWIMTGRRRAIGWAATGATTRGCAPCSSPRITCGARAASPCFIARASASTSCRIIPATACATGFTGRRPTTGARWR